MFKCLRVYPNGDAKYSVWTTENELEEWLDYNRVMRFGNALFVNGVCPNKETYTVPCPDWLKDEGSEIQRMIRHDRGYLTVEHVTMIETALKENPSLMRSCGAQEFSIGSLLAKTLNSAVT